ncbi:ABC transporter permease [Microlunatus sp. Y2014]|uniref:ABC transporter permease n=1 Tax=Microlunatus sp. Y2014 TaxID=3418488 RepID=UPI003DA7015E
MSPDAKPATNEELAIGAAPAPGPARAVPPVVGALRFFTGELRLIFGRRRNQVGLLVLAVIPILISIAIKVSGPDPGDGPGFLTSITENGFFVAVVALTLELPLFLPMAVATLSGDAIAGEAQLGTLRYVLTVPVNRTRLLATKYATLIVGAIVAPLLVATVGMISGGILFGMGPVTTISGAQIGLGEAIGRLLLMVGYLAVCLAAVGAIGLLVSTLTEQPIAATLATIGLVTIAFVLNQIPQLDWLHPFLLVHQWLAFTDLLFEPVLLDNITNGLLVNGAWAAVALSIAWARFSGRDITA